MSDSYMKKALVPGTIMVLALVFADVTSCRTAPAEPPPEIPASAREKPEPELLPEAELSGTTGVLTRMSALLGEGDYDGAIALFDEIDPEEAAAADIQILKASVLVSARRGQDARPIINKILAQEGENTDALLVLSNIFMAEGKERDQKQTLEKIVKIDPANADALTGLGNIALRANSYRNAASFFDKALAAAPENGYALVGRAGVYRHDKNYQRATALLNQAIKLYPGWAAPLSERARIYRLKGALPDAAADLRAAKELDPGDFWISHDLGNVLIDMNQKAEALEEFNRARDIEPDNFLSYVYTAGIKDDLGDYDGAEQDYAAVTRLKPEYYFAFEGLGTIKMKKGRWAEAKDAFLKAYQYAPAETAYALLAAANWMRAERLQSPRTFLEGAMRKVPRESLDYYMLRLYHDLNGDTDVAGRVDRERSMVTKARMAYYMGLYYEIRGSIIADRYYALVRDLDQKAVPEWRLNEWAISSRNLAEGAPGRAP
ncbi:MAG: tetratricopeptide repeat protein [Treponema sp.]|jgi:tetratricopeptide (TPR) repeat protein|nr:tetratricopeptide repeat protein [Treponema sp.]